MENKETKHLAYRKRCEEAPFRMYALTKKSWCKKREIEFDVDADYLESIWTGICPVLGLELNIPMKDARGQGSVHTAHLDRLDPNKGYVRGNVTWLSGRANRVKYDASLTELRLLVSWMESVTTNRDECSDVGSSDSKREAR